MEEFEYLQELEDKLQALEDYNCTYDCIECDNGTFNCNNCPVYQKMCLIQSEINNLLKA